MGSEGNGSPVLVPQTFFSFSGSTLISGDFGRVASWEVLSERGSGTFSIMGSVDFTDSFLSIEDDLVAGGGDTFRPSGLGSWVSGFAGFVSPSLCSRGGGGESEEAESFCFTSLMSFSAC